MGISIDLYRAAHEAGAATAIINIGKTRADDNFADLKINSRLEEICFRTTILIKPPIYLNPDYITTGSLSGFFASKVNALLSSLEINSHALANRAYKSGRNQELEKYWCESQVMAPRPRGPDNCADEFMLFRINALLFLCVSTKTV
ncbi:hypothetical protein Tco_1490327 [Tanacetum coccineum]